MARVERTALAKTAVLAFDGDAQHAGDSGDAVISESDNQFGRAIAFALPDPGRAHAIAETALHGAEAVRIAVVIVREIIGLGPQCPVVGANVENVHHAVFAEVDTGGIDG